MSLPSNDVLLCIHAVILLLASVTVTCWESFYQSCAVRVAEKGDGLTGGSHVRKGVVAVLAWLGRDDAVKRAGEAGWAVSAVAYAEGVRR